MYLMLTINILFVCIFGCGCCSLSTILEVKNYKAVLFFLSNSGISFEIIKKSRIKYNP